MKKELAILICGTFNPITNAHIALGSMCRKNYPKADIIYVPSNSNFMSKWKDIKLDTVFNTDSRLNLLYESLRKQKNFLISTIELDGTVDGRTYNTVSYFLEQYEQIMLCFGADKLDEIEMWYKFNELVNKVTFLIIQRNTDDFKNQIKMFNKKYPNKFKGILTEHYNDISSTKIRRTFFEHNIESIKKDIPKPCYDYLKLKLKEVK